MLYAVAAILMFARFTSVMKLSTRVGLLYVTQHGRKKWSFGLGEAATSEMRLHLLYINTTQVMFLEMGGDVSRWLSLTLFGTIVHSNFSFSSSSMSLTLTLTLNLTQAPSASPSPSP